jgi:vacuolar-type H+-ATPase catalytic subunit A/Vma1
MDIVSIRLVQLWRRFAGDEEGFAAMGKEAEKATKTFWDIVAESEKKAQESRKEGWKTIKEEYKNILGAAASENWVSSWKRDMDTYRQELEKMNNTHNRVMDEAINKRDSYNKKIDETFKLTQSMAQQFATATRLEQEQTKYLLNKAYYMRPGDVAGLTEEEKALVGKQGILKQAFSTLFEDYAKQQFGNSGNIKQPNVRIEISLSEEAKKLLIANEMQGEELNNNRFIAAMAG